MLSSCYGKVCRGMKSIFLIVLMSMAGSSAFARFSNDWPTASLTTAELLEHRIDKLLAKVDRQNGKSQELSVLQAIFRKTQKEFLHRYKAYANLDELTTGEFDCLTATSLFAAVL